MGCFASFLNANCVCISRGNSGCTTNTAFGYRALCSNTTGTCNTAVGPYALKSVCTGGNNTAVGKDALCTLTTGAGNTAVGRSALCSLLTSSNATAVGYRTARDVVAGPIVAIGVDALRTATTGLRTVAVGFGAGGAVSGCDNVAVGYRAMFSASTANGNTGVGRCVFDSLTTGDYNTAVGANSGGNVTTACYTIAIGNSSATTNTSGHTAFSDGTTNYNGVSCAWTNVSDARDKINVEDLDERLGLEFIRKLEVYSFNFDFRDRYVKKCGYDYGVKDGTLQNEKKSYGFSAQQMKGVLDELQVEFDALGYNQEEDSYRITYAELIAPLVKAVQQTKQRIENLESRTN